MAALDTLAPDARATLLSVMEHMSTADGSVDEEEAAALRGASVALGLVERASRPPVESHDPLTAAPTGRLSDRDRMLVFTGAAWLMLADGVRARGESRYLDWLAERLGLSEETAHFLAAHARWVRTESELPWHREFDWLLTEVAKRIGLLEARRAA